MNKEPLTIKSIFGVLEPAIHEHLVIYQQTSIKNILDNFPIEYNEDLSELYWSMDECYNGWFIREYTKDNFTRSHTGCDNCCNKELSEEEWDNYLHLQIPNYTRNNNEVLEFLLFTNSVKWLIRVIPTNVSKLYNMPSSLHVSLYNF